MKGSRYYDAKCYLHYAYIAAFTALNAYLGCDRFLVPLRPDAFTIGRFSAFGLLIFGALVLLHRQQEKTGETVVKGSTLLSPKAFNRTIDGDGIGIPSRLTARPSSPPVLLRVRKPDERKHILICGDTGSGKSALQHYLLHQILERGEDGAVVYDPSLEFWRAHARPERGDVLLYPLHDHCPYWDIASEMRGGNFTQVDAQKLAESLIPDREEGRTDFWDEAPREILSFLLMQLKAEGRGNGDLIAWLADRELLCQRLAGTALANLIDPQAPQQRAGVLSAFGKLVAVLALLPDRDGGRNTFSIAEWSRHRRGNIFIGTQGVAERKALRPLISLWLDTLFARLMLEMEGRPVWCFVDELPTLQRLPALKDAIQESRKYNLRFVLGFQGRSQLEQRYGREAEALMSAPDIRIFLKTSEPRAAEWIAQNIGQPRKEREQVSFNLPLIGLGRESLSRHTEERTDYLVYPNEIQTLAEREGYFCYGKYAVKIQFPYPSFLRRRNTLKVASPPG
jgi:type IV secretory pathway TraG/TraD family ATPase VirD4